LIHTQPGGEFLDADRHSAPKHIRVEPSPRSFMLKHVPLRWWEVLKLPIKPGLHQQKDIEIAWKRYALRRRSSSLTELVVEVSSCFQSMGHSIKIVVPQWWRVWGITRWDARCRVSEGGLVNSVKMVRLNFLTKRDDGWTSDWSQNNVNNINELGFYHEIRWNLKFSSFCWRISMCAPPLADSSLDRRLQNAYKSTRRGAALRTRGAPKTSGARVSG
jgi:hypothetical protein